ncbi:MAG TPA: sugar ABC transporter substrate-binding protein, partial [Epulopiscium sp.]|nr:sugar ABC transporter substrate-binding protein [Candidatus Epulonipiscium sp.]
AWAKIDEIKHEYLPMVVMATNFDSAWEKYMGVYEECKPEDFLRELQEEVDKRVATAAKYK